MNEKEESCIVEFKRKRRRAKRMREKRKKDAARQARADDRQKRIIEAAENMVNERIDKGELVKKNPGTEDKQQQTSTLKRAGSTMEDVPAAKVAKTVAMLREIESDHLNVSAQHLGSGSYGTCHLGTYRNMAVVVKTLHLRKLQHESDEEAEKRVRKELIYEGRIINKLGDHPGLPFLYGVCSRSTPFRLIMQFHGDLENKSALTISSALRKKIIADRVIWVTILKRVALALSRVHKVGFVHNDLKANNVVLEKENGEGEKYNPVLIDFGKSLPMTGLKGPKKLNEKEQLKYMRDYPHIAPEIVTGVKGQSVQSDIFSLGQLTKQVFLKAKLGRVPEVVADTLSLDPEKRPNLEEFLAALNV